MTSSRSPRAVMRLAHRVASRHLPDYPSRFSRRDRATQPQLFACLVLRQFYNLSYRRTEALLRDCPDLRRAIRMTCVPDHNTLCDAFERLARQDVVARMLDTLVRACGEAGLLGLDARPAAADSSCYESRHVSRHFERRRRDSSDASERSATVRGLPKLAICVACACHLILSFWTGTGMGGDHPHLDALAYHAWRRAPVTTLVADAGYDSEAAHAFLREDLNVESIIPATIGRPTGKLPSTPYRRLMARAMAEPDVRAVYGQRWQVETANSMMKRNYGSALRAATPARRERELMLKVLVHNLAI